MDLGFDPSGVLVVDVGTGKARIPPARRLIVFEEIRRAVSVVPGVAGAALADVTPVTGGAMAGDVEVLGRVAGGRETLVNRISAGWLSVYRTPVLSGRDFTDADRAGGRSVIIVNRAFARDFLNGENPIGHVVRQVHAPPGRPPVEYEIVGMTADAVYDSMRAPVPPTMYLAFDQIGDEALAIGAAPATASLSIRTGGVPPATLQQSVAAAIARVSPDVDLTFRKLPDVVSGSITLERVLAILSAFFGALSLLLAVVGLYGVTSYAVSRRRPEIGIRLALGATPGRVVRQVLSGVLTLVALGVLIGAGTSWWAARFMDALLFGVQPRDGVTFIGTIAVLLAVGAVAGWLPARSASKTDPLVALRCE